MIQGRIIKTVKVGIGGKEENVNERIVYPVYDKETGDEIILYHGVDAREYILTGRYVAFPPDGKTRPEVEVIRKGDNSEEGNYEEPSLPKVEINPVRRK